MSDSSHFKKKTYTQTGGVARRMLAEGLNVHPRRGRMAHESTIPERSTGRGRRSVDRRPRRYVRLTPEGVEASRTVRPPIRRIGRFEELALSLVNKVVAVIALVLLSPLMLVVAVLIRLDSPGPILYRQVRVGLDRRGREEEAETFGRRVSDIGGKPFEILKFRTMHQDAEKFSGPTWAVEDDPRVTRVGRVLRRTRLDEIPQFINVLRGEMAIVGPRPERPTFVQKLRDEIDGYPLRQKVPPGITGWAQVNRPADQTVDDVREKVGFDLEYLDRRSVWFDLWIMLKTVPVMFEKDNECQPR